MNILLFTGAGFGVPIKLPTTNGFKDFVSSSSSDLSNELQRHLGEKYNDIEHVLATLENFIKENSFIKSILDKRAVPNNEFYSVNGFINSLRADAKTTIQKIKTSIYEILQNFDRDSANELYQRLIAQIKSKYSVASLS